MAIYLAEIATPGNRGFYCSWQAVSQQVAVVFAALFGVALTWLVPPQQMALWGWRIPLFAGLLAIPLILWLRRSLEETEAFRHSATCAVHALKCCRFCRRTGNWWRTGIALTVMTTTSFYLITAYTPTYARDALHMPAEYGVSGDAAGRRFQSHLAARRRRTDPDRFGARPLMLAVTMAALALRAYPAMSWLVCGARVRQAGGGVSALFRSISGCTTVR